MKCYRVNYCGVRTAEKSTIMNVINDIRADVYPNIVWFKNELDGS